MNHNEREFEKVGSQSIHFEHSHNSMTNLVAPGVNVVFSCPSFRIFIGPESDHWLCLSLTHSLPNSCLVNLIHVTLACQDAYSKLVEAVSVPDVSDEDCVGNSLLQIWKLRLVKKLNFCSDFEHKVWSRF